MTLYNKEEIKYLVGNKDFSSKIKELLKKYNKFSCIFFSRDRKKQEIT